MLTLSSEPEVTGIPSGSPSLSHSGRIAQETQRARSSSPYSRDLQFDPDPDTPTFNWSGLGDMYVGHVKRTLYDIPVTLGLATYIEGTSKLNPCLSRKGMYRKFPLAMGVSSAMRSLSFAAEAYQDLMAGLFPGTDSPIWD